MEKMISELFSALKEKISSPFFRYYIISWCLWNYKFIYFFFFQDQVVFFNVHGISKFDFFQNSSFYSTNFMNWFFFLIGPLLSVSFFIYVFPWINAKILSVYIKTVNKEDEIKQEYKEKVKRRDLEIKEIELREENIDLEITKVEKQKEEVLSQEEIWNKEYDELKGNDVFYNSLIELQKIVYKWNGIQYNNPPDSTNKDLVAYADTHGISSIDEKRQVHLTEKGKHFMAKYLDEKSGS